jgi:hypothetical protein
MDNLRLWNGWPSCDKADILREFEFDIQALSVTIRRRSQCMCVGGMKQEKAERKAVRYHLALTSTMLLFYVDKKVCIPTQLLLFLIIIIICLFMMGLSST